MSISSKEDGSERRLARRVFTRIEVDINNDDHFLFAYITDLSETGIFVSTNKPEPAGSLLQLRFSAPSGGPSLEIEGEVIWTNELRPGDSSSINPGMGIRFVEMTGEKRRMLNSLVTKMALLNPEDNPESEPSGD